MVKRQSTLSSWRRVKRRRMTRNRRIRSRGRSVLYRRRRTFRRRRFVRRNKYLSGIYAQFTTPIKWSDIGDDGFATMNLNLNIAAMIGDISPQLTGYRVVFDQAKVLRIKRTVWLNDSDEYTKADQRVTELYSSYDPDANGSSLTQAQIIQDPSHRMVIMKPFSRYRYWIKPNWRLQNATQGTPALFSYTGYNDILDWQADRTGNSANSVHMVARGTTEQGAINYQDTYYIHFKKRIQNAGGT